MSSTAPRPWRPAPVLAMQIVVAILLVLRLYADLNAHPVGDEAYYWMWGQRLGWSYFDHPPLHSWLQRLVQLIFGWPLFAIRLLTWLTLAGTLAIFWDWSKRLNPGDPQGYFWSATAIYLASPLVFVMGMAAYNDHLLLFLGLLAIHLFLLFAGRYESGQPGAIRLLYLAAIALGLAVLTKYNGVFVGVAFGLFVLIRKPLRPLLLNPHLWFAALLAIAMQAPVFYWNFTEGFASYQFHLHDRWGDHFGRLDPRSVVIFIAMSILTLSPFLVWPLFRFLRSRPAEGFERRAKTLAVTLFWTSTLAVVGFAAYLGGFFYWNLMAFAGVMPLLVRSVGTRFWLWSHLIFGTLFSALVVINFSVIPLAPFFGIGDGATSINYGWDQVAADMRAARQQHPADFIAGTRYSTSSQLAFALADPSVTAISVDHDQYDYWFDPAEYLGKDALILTDERDNSPTFTNLAAHFDKLTVLEPIEISRFGRNVYRWRIVLGEDYRQ